MTRRAMTQRAMIRSAPPRKRVAVLISGRGSNLQALIEAQGDPAYPAEIVLVVSSRADARGLDRAGEAGIDTLALARRDFASGEALDGAITAALEAAGVELVALAGYMRLLTRPFVEHWRDRMINIHPSLLPLFPGLDTHARALEAGVRLHGCSVHFVRLEMDSGPLIGQAAVPVLTGDDPESLAARVLAVEHRLYPHCLKLLAGGRVRVEGERAVIDGQEEAGALLINPADGLSP